MARALRAASRLFLATAVAGGVGACTAASPAVPARLDARLPEGRRVEDLRRLAAGLDHPEGENIVARELGRDGDSSHHLVSVRDREPPHRHDCSALTVVILRGQGRMMIEGREEPVGEGSVLYVPRATVHAFLNEEGAADPAVAYAVFSPPQVAADRVRPEAPLPGTTCAGGDSGHPPARGD